LDQLASGKVEQHQPSQANDLAEQLWKQVSQHRMSASHDRWHIERVLGFALALQARHGGDVDILTAAVLMHDLGRADDDRSHGLASIEASTELAELILNEMGYSPEGTTRILQAIREHDQPALRPTTIEGRILKEADFLAGVGAWGVLRIAMWSGETHRDIQTVMDRLQRGMTRRVDSLEFPESIELARRELDFARLFVARLGLPPDLAAARSAPYIVLEGISGSGKDTQATALAARMAEWTVEPLVVCEPHGDYTDYKNAWSKRHKKPRLTQAAVIKWLMIADRQQLIDERVRPALLSGTPVISVRSYLSTIVYQGSSPAEEAAIAFQHDFVPRPSAVVILDLPASVALERIRVRDHEKGAHETVEQLASHRMRYLHLGAQFFGARCHVVDATVGHSHLTNQLVDLAATVAPTMGVR
jgi:dTMP kinase